ncbi:hypothetical protein ACFVVL_00100 [Kitasatospora sp. NPDC058115]|uniref:hypothetical protein n=1 Tax=Kitasatospora sp. NPDC058115 TaxID=3346347 RepID=UPI0036DA1842
MTTLPSTDYAFRDNAVPRVEAGLYRVTVTHDLPDIDDPAAKAYFGDPVVRTLDVRTPRFRLPPGAVHSAHPAHGCVGTFDDVLPHLTLDHPELPWQTALGGTAPRKTPFLALLLFGAGELPGDPEATGRTDTRTVRDLLATPPAEAVVPVIDPASVEADVLDSDCATIDVPAGLFARVAPRLDELHLLAHLRLGGDEPQSLPALAARARSRSVHGVVRAVPRHAGPVDADDPQQPGLHGVILANRFPDPAGGQHAVHLVSLEGHAERLPTSDTATGAGAPPLRLVALHSWTFRSLPDVGPHFGAVMARLAAAGSPHPEALTLRLDPKDAVGDLGDRLTRGFVPVSHQLPTGEHSYAWYRGPLTATPAAVPPTPTAPYSADAWLVYDQHDGVFDVGYAAAWTLGRSLAMADDAFTTALMTWRGAVRQALGRALTARPGRRHGSLSGTGAVLAGRRDAAALLDPRAARDVFRASVPGGRLAGLVPQARPAHGPGALGDHPGPPPGPGDPGPASDRLRACLADEGFRRALGAVAATSEAAVLDWLDRLALLRPVPFDHLVPDGRALPDESLRLFHVDPGWQSALVHGALSVGSGTSLDLAANDRIAAAALAGLPRAVTGFLVRSALVPTWPALRVRVRGTLPGGGSGALTVVRADVLAPDVLLIAVDGLLDAIDVAEPPQAMHLGYRYDDGTHGDHLQLRELVTGIGTLLGLYQPLAGHFRESGAGLPRVLRTAALGTDLRTLLGAHAPDGPLGPAGFALQLLAAPLQMTFQHPSS